jgi:hypothetical protein
MKKLFYLFIIGTLVLLSCNSNKSFISGAWTIDNLNSSDSSINVETLFATFIAKNYTGKNILTFSADKVIMKTADGKELGQGDFSLSGDYLTIKFPSDKMESKYKIIDKSDKAIKLTATDNGETINISLIKIEK